MGTVVGALSLARLYCESCGDSRVRAPTHGAVQAVVDGELGAARGALVLEDLTVTDVSRPTEGTVGRR